MQPANGETFVQVEEKYNFKQRGGVIIGMDDKIVSAAKGSKRYIVLPFGSIKTYFVEERFEDQTKGQEGKEVRVTPIVPVVLIPKKEDKVENDPKPRKIKKKENK